MKQKLKNDQVTAAEKKASKKEKYLEVKLAKENELKTFVEDFDELSQYKDGFKFKIFVDAKQRKYQTGSTTAQSKLGKFACTASVDAVNVGEALDVLTDATGTQELSDAALDQWVWAAKNAEADAKAFAKFCTEENSFVFDAQLFAAAYTMAKVTG